MASAEGDEEVEVEVDAKDGEGVEVEGVGGMMERSTRSFVNSATVKSDGLRNITTSLEVRTCWYWSIRNCLRMGSSRCSGGTLPLPLPLLPLPLVVVDGEEGTEEACRMVTDGIEAMEGRGALRVLSCLRHTLTAALEAEDDEVDAMVVSGER